MKISDRKYIFFIILSVFFIYPSYAINLSSGITPIKNDNNYYWWIENSTSCAADIKVWISSGDDLSNNNSYIKKTVLNEKERTVLTVPEYKIIKFKEPWLNIIQKSNACHSTRVTRFKLNVSSTDF
jgi:hypothetical protein